MCEQHAGLVGRGIVCDKENELHANDLDDCIDAGGQLAPAARLIIDQYESYTEVSPSGKRLRVLATSRLPGLEERRQGCRKAAPWGRGQLEAYQGKHFMTLTGNVFYKMIATLRHHFDIAAARSPHRRWRIWWNPAHREDG